MRQDLISLRPVTPLGIIASNLARLHEGASAFAHADREFLELLERTAILARGFEPYLETSTTPASPELAKLVADTVLRDWDALHASGETSIRLEAEMVSGHVEGQLLKLLIRSTRAKRVLEIGLFTGYSALAMAEGLPDDGRLVACEIDAYAAAFAREAFDTSPHGRKIRIEVGPALGTLERMRDAGDTYDFVFIDADKSRYADYLEILVGTSLLAPDGLVCVDNTLMQGEPYLDGTHTVNGKAIAEFNRFVARDPRVEQVMLPVRDGLTLIRRC